MNKLKTYINSGSLATNITPTFIKNITDLEIYIEHALYWKHIMQGLPMNPENVLIKTAFYQHHLYEKARTKITLYDM